MFSVFLGFALCFFQDVANLQKFFQILTEKSPYIGEPVHFKPMLFKGQFCPLFQWGCLFFSLQLCFALNVF